MAMSTLNPVTQLDKPPSALFRLPRLDQATGSRGQRIAGSECDGREFVQGHDGIAGTMVPHLNELPDRDTGDRKRLLLQPSSNLRRLRTAGVELPGRSFGYGTLFKGIVSHPTTDLAPPYNAAASQ